MTSKRASFLFLIVGLVINTSEGFYVSHIRHPTNDATFYKSNSTPSSRPSYPRAALNLSMNTISASSTSSAAAQWHNQRRKSIIAKYPEEIKTLEQQTHGLFVGLPLLVFSNVCLSLLAIKSASLSIPMIALIAIPSSVFSLWQLQILHDALHSSLLPKPTLMTSSRVMKKIIKHRKGLQNFILYFGSIPSAFGYYLYLKYGHLTHHKSLGDSDKASLATLFNSTQKDFEDGDILFTAHRMKLLGPIGPSFPIPWAKDRDFTMSISKSGFSLWKEGNALRNALIFISSFMFERIMLIMNDFVVAIAGRNFFFPNKPKEFHDECARYCRSAVLFRLALCFAGRSFKPLLYLYFAETLWSIPPHPASAMFITNHPSKIEADGSCIPSSSTYAGRWYSLFTLGTNFHVEHHDFPTIPLHLLWKLRRIAPEFYKDVGDRDNIFQIMRKTFQKPDFYACMNSNNIQSITS